MKKIERTASALLIAAMLFCFLGCPNGNTPETPNTPNSPSSPSNPSTPSNPVTPAVTITSGIYAEGGVFYINVEADKASASGNGAW